MNNLPEPQPRSSGRPRKGEGERLTRTEQKRSHRKVEVDVEYAPIVHHGWVELSEFSGVEFNDGTFPRALATKQGVQIPIGMCTRCRQIIHNTADNRSTHRAWCRNVTQAWKERGRVR